MKIGKVCAKHPELKGERNARGECRGCCRAYFAKWRAKQGTQKQRTATPARVESTAEARAAKAEYMRRYRAANAGKMSAIKRRYKTRNADKVAADYAARRAAAKMAKASWGNAFFIREAYALAKLREKVCGGTWHVDHIVPLRSKLVCGLHVEHNLRVVPASDNQVKGNRIWPDMP